MMKANELTPGDWLYYRGRFNAFPLQVEQVTRRKVGYHAEPHENRMYYLRLHEVEPIPLTPEILEHNGLRLVKEYGKYEWRNGNTEVWVILDGAELAGEKQHCIHIEDYVPKGRCIPVHYHNTIAYLHELQHALRLCRIDKEITL